MSISSSNTFNHLFKCIKLSKAINYTHIHTQLSAHKTISMSISWLCIVIQDVTKGEGGTGEGYTRSLCIIIYYNSTQIYIKTRSFKKSLKSNLVCF